MLLPNNVICGNQKLRFIKEQEASTKLSSLRIRASLNKNSLVSTILC